MWESPGPHRTGLGARTQHRHDRVGVHPEHVAGHLGPLHPGGWSPILDGRTVDMHLQESSPMQEDRNERPGATRRDLLQHTLATGAALSFPSVVPARALGRGGAVAPGEKITLGVIGIGPRCTYDLQSILALP